LLPALDPKEREAAAFELLSGLLEDAEVGVSPVCVGVEDVGKEREDA